MIKRQTLDLLKTSLFTATIALGANTAIADPVKECGEDAEKHGKNILARFTTAKALFTDGKESDKSRAKATIWSDAAGFEAAFKKGTAGAQAVADAGSEFDEDAFKAAFKQLPVILPRAILKFRF